MKSYLVSGPDVPALLLDQARVTRAGHDGGREQEAACRGRIGQRTGAEGITIGAASKHLE